jgi:hypothetical protein
MMGMADVAMMWATWLVVVLQGGDGDGRGDDVATLTS